MVIITDVDDKPEPEEGDNHPSYQQQRKPGPKEMRPRDFRNFLCQMALALFLSLKGLWNPGRPIDLCMLGVLMGKDSPSQRGLFPVRSCHRQVLNCP